MWSAFLSWLGSVLLAMADSAGKSKVDDSYRQAERYGHWDSDE